MTDPLPGPLLDWKEAAHWSKTPGRCVHCGGQTSLRDDRGRPSHKVCAEAQHRAGEALRDLDSGIDSLARAVTVVGDSAPDAAQIAYGALVRAEHLHIVIVHGLTDKEAA